MTDSVEQYLVSQCGIACRIIHCPQLPYNIPVKMGRHSNIHVCMSAHFDHLHQSSLNTPERGSRLRAANHMAE